MKRSIILAWLIFFLKGLSFSQTGIDREAIFSRHGQYLQPFIELQHKYFYKGQMDSLRADFETACIFQIDTGGRIINYRAEKSDVPPVVIDYVKSLIYMTDGQWRPEISNCRLQTSQEISCRVYLNSKKISLSERLENREKELERFYNNQRQDAQLPVIIKEGRNKIFIFLSY